MYYQLICSLPRLPHFAKAEFLPITRLQLHERLRLLTESDEQQLRRALELVRWRADRALGRDDAGLLSEYRALDQVDLHPELRQYLDFRMQQRTLLAALRRKRAGLAAPTGQEVWGAEPLASTLRRQWEKPHFGIAHQFRWLPEAESLLAAGDAQGLERLLMDAAWRQLTRIGERDMFGLAAVFAYAARWEIVQCWLSADAARGKTNFQKLIDQVTHVEDAS